MIEKVITEDGEIVDLNQLVEERAKVIAGQIIENNQKRNQIYKRIATAKNNKRLFLQLDEGNGREMLKKISLADAGVLYILITCIHFQSNGLLAKQGQDGQRSALKKKDLIKLLNKSKNGFDNAVGRLEKVGAIRIDRSQKPYKYFINEELVRFGNRKGSGEFTKVYRSRSIELFKRLSKRELGAIFMCLPYIHYSTHVLVFNTHEKDLSKVHPINGRDLAKIFRLDYTSLTNLTSNLKHKGALMLIEEGKGIKGYVLNPNIADRGFLTEFTDRTLAYFKNSDELAT